MQNVYTVLRYLWPVRLYNIFPICRINGAIFGKELTEREICVLVFPTTFISNISHSEKNSA